MSTDRPTDPATPADAATATAEPGGTAAPGTGMASPVSWHRPEPAPVGPPVLSDGRLEIAELASDRPAASSPFGDDVQFPLNPETLNYRHPSAPGNT